MKNPAKVRGGQASARKRWGEYPRVVRLDDLDQPTRRLVLALVKAAKAEQTRTSSAVDEYIAAAQSPPEAA